MVFLLLVKCCDLIKKIKVHRTIFSNLGKWISNLGVEGVLNSKSIYKSYELFHFSCSSIKFIFLVILEELPNATMWLKLPKRWRMGTKNNVVLSIKSDFDVQAFDFFKKICTIHSVKVLAINPFSLKQL